METDREICYTDEVFFLISYENIIHMIEKFPESLTEKSAAEAIGRETAEGLIARVEESLESGFFDKKEREDAERMLRTAQMLTQSSVVRKEIDRIFVDIENIYGEA